MADTLIETLNKIDLTKACQVITFKTKLQKCEILQLFNNYINNVHNVEIECIQLDKVTWNMTYANIMDSDYNEDDAQVDSCYLWCCCSLCCLPCFKILTNYLDKKRRPTHKIILSLRLNRDVYVDPNWCFLQQ